MSIKWLAVKSFQHSQDLLAAINALSINLKLASAGKTDGEHAAQATQARETLGSFLTMLEPVVADAEGGETKPVLGADPRLRQLAKSFVSAKRNRHRFHSALFRDTFTRVQQLLYSPHEEDRQPLLECLGELRVLIEEHVHTDAEQVLGEF
jgi:hypothetical protein